MIRCNVLRGLKTFCEGGSEPPYIFKNLRSYCCYSNLLCHKINGNLFPDDWAVCWYHDVGVNKYRMVITTHQTLSLEKYWKLFSATVNHIWQRTFPFKALIAIFWDLQPLWPSSLTKPDLLIFRCSSGHVLSETVTPHFFNISEITNSSSFSGKIFRKNQC